MLQFILGKSGSGKTSMTVDILTKLRQSGSTKLIMLVPDQNSFETETAFLNTLGAGLCRDVKVFGFDRLCDYVFKQTGNIPQNVIDDGVRKIIISKALKQCQDKLELFSSAKTRKSALELMLHSLTEWKKNGITCDMINSVKDNIESETLKKKLSETSLVLEAYDAILSGTYIDPLDNLKRLNNILETNALFDDYTVAVDSFSGFTYQQLETLSTLMSRSKDFYVTLNLDVDDMYSDVFATTCRTYKALKRIAKLNGTEIKPDIILSGRVRSQLEEFSFLEKNVFRINKEVYRKNTDNIETFIATDIYSETAFAARRIMSLVVDSGYNYRDIAVICRDISMYSGILDTVFDKFNIPYFMNVERDVYSRPVIRFICSALECVIFGYDRERLLSMLKTGLVSLSETEIADFENYLFTWNINYSSLKTEFKNNPSGFEKLTKRDKKKLEEIENTRKYAIEPLVKFKNKCKNATVLEITAALYELMSVFDLENAVNQLYDRFESEGRIVEAGEEVRVYNLFIDALNKLVAAAGQDSVGLKTYKEYLDYLIEDIKFSDIPAYSDQINVGAAERVRLNGAKIVFAIGAVDGVFPSIPRTAGAFSEGERRILIDNNIPLTDSLDELAAHEKYLAYCALTSPCEKLIVTLFTGNYSGESFLPSEIYNELDRLFPKRLHSSSDEVNEGFELYNEQQAFEYLAEKFTENSPEISALKDYFNSIGSYKHDINRIENVLKKRPFQIKNIQTAEKLFGRDINISASQLEKYNLCAFRYFCNYGLRAKKRNTAVIDAVQVGNVVHYVLENFLKNHNKSVLNTLSDESIRESIDSITADYAEENYGGLSDKPESFKNLIKRLKQNIFALTKHLICQLADSDFVPADFELKIGAGGEIPGYKLDIDKEHSVTVNGFIDRVDISEKSNDEYYIRIVDYKTGQKTFRLYDILYGINTQMLIYLNAVQKNGGSYYGKRLVPSGILYMPAFAPVIKSDENNINKKFRDELKMNGLILNDAEIIHRMDKNGEYIGLSKKLIDGKYSDTLADEEQFNIIFKHIDDTIRAMGKALLDGKVDASPLRGIENGCKFCPYDSVCLRKNELSKRFKDKADAKEVYHTLEKGALNR